MKSENEEVTMDDLVFENRNKEYGAYAIRKSYSENIHKALAYALFTSVAAAMLPLVFPGTLLKAPPAPFKDVITLGDFKFEQPAVARPVAPAAPRTANPDVMPTITDQVVEEIVAPVVEATSGTVDGPVGEVEYSGTGTDVEVVPATPEVVDPPKPVDWAEVMPKNEGMIRYLQRNLRYPAVARRMGVEGAVFVSFVVNTDGRVMDVRVLKGISKECDEEAARVISAMPAWTAGRQGNMPVMVRMVLPIKFKLSI